MPHTIWIPVACYLAGSIPFGLLIGRLAGKDVRTEGSGNIGATNVLRVCGVGWGVFALLMDAFKGFAPVFWIALPLAEASDSPSLWRMVGGIAAILGHNFPVWLGFKGGKGVASTAGVMLALWPGVVGIAFASWCVGVVLTRYVSIGSLLAATAIPTSFLILYWSRGPFTAALLPETIASFLMCLMGWVRHTANIQRLWRGEESRIFAKKKTGAESPAAEADPTNPAAANDQANAPAEALATPSAKDATCDTASGQAGR